MRPIFRDRSPLTSDFTDYRDAFPYLLARLGPFCSYCERRIATQLAVEHIQPKDASRYPHLIGRWENFLLGCVNCNSTKKDKDVVLGDALLPDRDNTFVAYRYSADGKVEVAPQLSDSQQAAALKTLALTGLDKPISRITDENGRLVAIDRVAQRMEVRLIAQESLCDLQLNPTETFRKQIVRTALGHGFFSIWMDVFASDSATRQLLIEGFQGTARDCFDAQTQPIGPSPTNGLPEAGKT